MTLQYHVLLCFVLILFTACGERVVAPSSPAPTADVVAPSTPPQEPVEGVVPILRDDTDDVVPDRIAVRHILIAWQGVSGAREQLRRNREQAVVIANEVRARVASGDDFATVATEVSDGPSRATGGDLGAFSAGAMHPAFEDASFSLAINEISDIVETPFGFHIIQRYALDEIRVAHILVQWDGVPRSEVTRTQDEAQILVDTALAELKSGAQLSAVAATYSDGPTGLRGGELGWFQRGQMVPSFDEVAFQLQPGQISEVVESPLGFHIIVRLE